MSLTEKEAPFTEPYGLPDSDFKSKGNTALAVKRALAHLGFLEWEPEKWDKHWNAKVNDAAAEWKRKRGIIGKNSSDGSWGKKAHDTMRSTWYEKSGDKLDAFDGESQRLLREEKSAATPDMTIEDIQRFIVEFCEKGMGSPKWNYTQNRAVEIDVDPEGNVDSDCSGSVIQAYEYARDKTGLAVLDPSKQNWSGYGNTSYYEDDHPTVSDGHYRVGDLAHYDGHVCLCIKAGNKDTADWWSFGSEPPSRRKLNYRSDFRKVVRPPLL